MSTTFLSDLKLVKVFLRQRFAHFIHGTQMDIGNIIL